MGIAVLTEPVEGGYRAAIGAPLEAEVVAESREQAKEQLLNLIAHRLRHGAEVDNLELPAADGEVAHPLSRFAGKMRDDEIFEEWQEAIREFRAERDAVTDW